MVAGLIAGWTGGALVGKCSVRPAAAPAEETVSPSGSASPLAHVLLIVFAMGLGSLINMALQSTGLVLPAFVGALVAAVTIRNVDDRLQWIGIHQQTLDQLLGIFLPLFIAMAMLTLKLWELTAIALPLLLILLAEVALTMAFCVYVTFWAMGRDYEAAVTSAGFCGFMLGITPNAMASMEELREKHGPAPRAFLIVPMVGAFLIDLINTAVITTCLNLFR
jgi:ESS family glutamate:Na+ symporter